MKKYSYPPEVSSIRKFKALFTKSSNSIKIMEDQFKEYGDTYMVSSPLTPYKFLITRDPEFTDFFMRKSHKNFEKSIFQTDMLKKYVGNGLLTNRGDNWKRQRKLIQPGFSHKKIESLNQLMLKEIEKSIDEIPMNKELDFYPIFNRLAFNVVAKSLFSSNVTQSQIDRIAEVINESQELFAREARNPVVQYWLKYSGKLNRFVKNDVQDVRNIFRDLINERKQSGEETDDILDLMLNSRYEDNGEPMDGEQLIDELLILFIAGHETTANALSFTFYLLATHPEEKNKLIKEIQSLGKNAFELEYLFMPSNIENIIKESMRLYPPAWITDRQAINEGHFGNYHWPKDTIFVANLYSMNRLENIWDKPNEFIPERFADPEIKSKPYIPFGSGPRYCIGEHFAIMEMQLVLRAFFQKYDFNSIQKDVKLLTYVTLRPDKILGEKTKL